MTQDEERRQRRRRRGTAAAGPPLPSATSAPIPPARSPSAGSRPKQANAAPAPQRRERGERGLRDLVGPGSSLLGVSRALRARDVNRPTDDDLAAAAAELRIVRRDWRPQS